MRADNPEPPAKRRPRLTPAEDAAIRDAYARGESRQELAAKWGIDQVRIGKALERAQKKLELLIGPRLEPPRPVRYVSIPRTGGRASLFFKVITAVRANWAAAGFAFEGRCLPPGRRVPEDAVFLDGQDPEFAIAIEHAGPDREAGRQHLPDGSGQARFPTIYILWRCARESLTWRELARSTAIDATWALDLGPIAARALSPAAARADVELLPRLEAAAARILAFIREELARFEPSDHDWLLGLLHDPLAAIFVAALEQPMRRPPARSLEARIVPQDEKEDVG